MKNQMKKSERIQNTGQHQMESGQLSIEPRKGLYSEAGKNLRRFIFLACIAGTAIAFTGCFAGHVAREPVYVQYQRPSRPSTVHVWIDDDWAWSRQSHAYLQRAGYWERPRQNQVYVSGDWRSTPKGKAWSKGHWQKANQRRNKR